MAWYFMQLKNTPIHLWTCAFVYAEEVSNCISLTHVSVRGVTLFKMIYGYTPDLSEYISHLNGMRLCGIAHQQNNNLRNQVDGAE